MTPGGFLGHERPIPRYAYRSARLAGRAAETVGGASTLGCAFVDTVAGLSTLKIVVGPVTFSVAPGEFVALGDGGGDGSGGSEPDSALVVRAV